MAIGRYYKYRCKKCGYTFTKFESDVIIPPSCPKCGGDVEIISSSITNNPLEDVVEKIKEIFKK